MFTSIYRKKKGKIGLTHPRRKIMGLKRIFWHEIIVDSPKPINTQYQLRKTMYLAKKILKSFGGKSRVSKNW